MLSFLGGKVQQHGVLLPQIFDMQLLLAPHFDNNMEWNPI